MKTLKITLLLAIGIVLTNCSDSTKSKYILGHTILNDEVYDDPLKTQVKLDVLISDIAVTEQKVRDLLMFLYEKSSERTGFEHHTSPTNIYIYIYH